MTKDENKQLVENFEFRDHGFFWTLQEDVNYFEFNFFVQQERIETEEDKERFYEEVINKLKSELED